MLLHTFSVSSRHVSNPADGRRMGKRQKAYDFWRGVEGGARRHRQNGLPHLSLRLQSEFDFSSSNLRYQFAALGSLGGLFLFRVIIRGCPPFFPFSAHIAR